MRPSACRPSYALRLMGRFTRCRLDISSGAGRRLGEGSSFSATFCSMVFLTATLLTLSGPEVLE